MTTSILMAKTPETIRACFRTMGELRPHLTEEVFVAQVQRQMRQHAYKLVYIEEPVGVVAAAGYRVAEFLAWGKAFYLDDLATHSGARKKGYGGLLLDWLLEEAEREGCGQFHLDSGSQRYDAHRLYMSRHMSILAHHFVREIV